jgi:hypothetical protein
VHERPGGAGLRDDLGSGSSEDLAPGTPEE